MSDIKAATVFTLVSACIAFPVWIAHGQSQEYSVRINTRDLSAHAVIVAPDTALLPLHVGEGAFELFGRRGELVAISPTLELALFRFDGNIGEPARLAHGSAGTGTRARLHARAVTLREKKICRFDGRWLAMRRVDGKVKPGDSGSAIVNASGEVIAIVGFNTRTGGGWAADVADVRRFLRENGVE